MDPRLSFALKHVRNRQSWGRIKRNQRTWLFSITKGSRRKGRRERKIKYMVGIKNSWREKIERNHSLQKEKEMATHSSVLA